MIDHSIAYSTVTKALILLSMDVVSLCPMLETSVEYGGVI